MKRIIVITCTSYTVVSVLAALLNGVDYVPVFSPLMLLQLFLVTLSIAVLMFFSEKLEKFDFYNLFTDLAIRLAICFGVVFFGGVLFGWFALSWESILYIVPLTAPTFIITYLVSYFTVFSYAQNINDALKKRKEKAKSEKI